MGPWRSRRARRNSRALSGLALDPQTPILPKAVPRQHLTRHLRHTTICQDSARGGGPCTAAGGRPRKPSFPQPAQSAHLTALARGHRQGPLAHARGSEGEATACVRTSPRCPRWVPGALTMKRARVEPGSVLPPSRRTKSVGPGAFPMTPMQPDVEPAGTRPPRAAVLLPKEELQPGPHAPRPGSARRPRRRPSGSPTLSPPCDSPRAPPPPCPRPICARRSASLREDH